MELLEDWADDQPSIDLAALNVHAQLLSRVDRKYLLTSEQAFDSLRLLAVQAESRSEALAVLSTGPDALSRYESVYFDTPGLDSFHQTARKRRRRFKVRTRSYLDSGLHYLEVKTAVARGVTRKERIEIAPGLAGDMDVRALSFVEACLADAQIDPSTAARLRPTITTTYKRLTVLQPDGVSRATVDVGLAWNGQGRTIRPAGIVIVETKSAAGTSPLDRLLWRGRNRPQSFSKFGTGMALTIPGLPANKWTRAIRDVREGQDR
ncbi:VTC domain-containing protein [Rarobacter faecitabidus]|uniref:VTC domain-containing protein n=2 Tax=Rarobacter faecitabidus TaxID=13243 RepID=A0A542ZXI5_RARFA|nr:VTC domain-containing protein [Rarobacter faecitabidus]